MAVAVYIALVAVFATLAYRFINWVWLRPKLLDRCLRDQGLTGSSYRFLFGDLKDQRRMNHEAKAKPISLSSDIVPRLLSYVDQHIKKYGENSFTWMGPVPRVFILELDLIREVFNRIGEFHKPPTHPIVRLLAAGLASYDDEKWAKHRKLLNPAFHLQKLKNMVPAFNLCTSEMLSKWETLFSEDGSCELDVWPDLQDLARDVISRTAFGSSFEEGRRIFELQKEIVSILVQIAVLFYIPGYRFLPTKLNRRIKEMDKEVQATLRGIIAKKENAMKAGTAVSDDLLGILIESNLNEMKEHKNDKSVGMTTEEVIQECKLFYLAGQETTAVLLAWTMIMLSQHKEWQARAREEVQQVFGDEEPHMEGLNQLKILNMILHEVLRLYPPVTILDRATHKETKLGDLILPAGVRVSVPVLLVHHDSKIWGEDAKEFKPERFADGVANASKGQVPFMPFSWGPRICIGMNFSFLEAKVALAMILQRFLFELSPTYTHAPCSIITIQPQHGAQLVLFKN
uniref:Cytochrome P450 n=2 Tax=Kalanchoe fedtschenkoi TaxID=63787 RepID=A0A7N0VE30_KALFE